MIMKARDKFSLIAIGLTVWLVMSLSYSNGLFFGLESFFEDLFVSEKPVDDRIVIVAVDDESLLKIGQWPWPREIFARALENLEKNPPAAVGMDVIFADPSRIGKSDDAELARSLNEISYPVILPVEASPLRVNPDKTASADALIETLPEFRSAKSVTVGHVNLLMDADGVVRKFPAEISDYPAFAIKVKELSKYDAVTGSRLPPSLELRTGKQGRDDSGFSNIQRIVYSAAPGKIRKIPFWRILDDANIDLSGKIVLIGATSADLHDEKLTPMSRGSEMPGVEIQANIVNMLLQNYRLNPLSDFLMISWLMLMSVIPMTVFIFSGKTLNAVLWNSGFIFANLIAVIILSEYGVSANLIHIVITGFLATAAGFGYRYAIKEKEKREMRNLFSKYVSGDVLDEILKNPESVALGGEEKEITVFFSDIRGFTTLSEKTTPKELVSILNRYFTAMTNQVLKNGGVLDKYIGDAIMAFWARRLQIQIKRMMRLKRLLR